MEKITLSLIWGKLASNRYFLGAILLLVIILISGCTGNAANPNQPPPFPD